MKFKTGAIPTPKHKLFAAPRHDHTTVQALSQVAYIPKTLDMWGNDQYGDCVSAEEAFNQDVCGAFIDASTVEAWARKNGFLNGANLTDVMDAMAQNGMQSGGKTYGDGPYAAVNFSNETALQAALSVAPVKIGIDSSALPSGAGNHQGWYAFGGNPGQFTNEDHCVGLAGYGPASFCFAALNTPVPSGTDPGKVCYLLFTWSTIGVVDHDWIMSTVGEAWLRNPDQTVNGQPQPNPSPPSPTPPPVPPSPPVSGDTLTLTAALAAGSYPVPGIGTLVLAQGLAVGSYSVTFTQIQPTPPAPPTPTPPTPTPVPVLTPTDLANIKAMIPLLQAIVSENPGK